MTRHSLEAPRCDLVAGPARRISAPPRRRRAWAPRVAIILALLAALLLVMPLAVSARGGGGGHGGGGGGHSSGGSSFGGSGGGSYSGGWGGGYGGGSSCSYSSNCSSGGGVGGILGLILALVFGGPFLIIFIIVMLVARRHGGGAVTGYSPPPAMDGMPVPGGGPDAVAAGLAAIKEADPGFNLDVFLERAQMAFFTLQTAWQHRNVDESRAYMAPGLYASWNAQVQQMITLHKTNILENLNIQGMHAVKVVHDEHIDAITLQIDAVCADYEVNDDSGKVVFGSKKDAPFTEYWTFTRSSGTKTVVNGGVTAQKCPNCGAPISINTMGECTYCKASVTSGQFDWVLSKIDQANEWQG